MLGFEVMGMRPLRAGRSLPPPVCFENRDELALAASSRPSLLSNLSVSDRGTIAHLRRGREQLSHPPAAETERLS